LLQEAVVISCIPSMPILQLSVTSVED